MARTRTLTALQTEVRVLTDTVGDEHVSDAQLLVWINQGIAELWRKLVGALPDRYALYETIATTAGTDSYALEDDFMSIYRVERVEGRNRYPIEPFNMVAAPYRNTDPQNGAGQTRYRIVGGGIDGAGTRIVFDPDPGTATYGYWYIQAPQLLASGADEFDGIAGYEDRVVLYAALRVYIRQQDPDQAAIAAEIARIDAAISASAAHRDVGHAPRIADVRPRRGVLRRGWR